MVSLLAVSALAIDLTTLYVAHGEIQRAADAAALAGAKAFVDSGVTTNPSNGALADPGPEHGLGFRHRVVKPEQCRWRACEVYQRNTARSTSTSASRGTPNAAGNPRITVTLQRTGLPLFFARIWGNIARLGQRHRHRRSLQPGLLAEQHRGLLAPRAQMCEAVSGAE